MSTLSNALVVPVDIRALCVGDTDVNGSVKNPYGTKDFSRLAPDFSLLPYAKDGTAHNKGPYISYQVLPDSFQPVSDPLDVGIHLHWALPDAIAHGAQSEESGSIEFPPAPNRWLVVRIATNSANPEKPASDLKAWVVESDRLWDKSSESVPLDKQNKKSLDVPIKPNPTVDNNKSSKTLGRAFPYETWSEDPNADRASLTATGYGESTYAAVYEFCRNVFGFWDTLEDLNPTDYPPNSTRVSYVLTGWHSDASDDPMTRITYPSDATYNEKIAHIKELYKWAFEADTNNSVPTRTLYNALMTDIPWDKSTHYIDKKNPGPDLEIAVGNTTAEALSALLAAQSDLSGLQNVEIILNALQLGLLNRMNLPGGLAAIDEVLHQNAFASSSHGTIWCVEAKSAGKNDDVVITDESMLDATSNDLGKLSPQVGDALNKLNKSQEAYDKAVLEIASLQGRIFSDWYRFVKIEYATLQPKDVNISADDARNFTGSEITLLNNKKGALRALQSQVNQDKEDLTGLIGDDYVLTSTSSARYWNLSEPVVLFSGEDVKQSYRYDHDDSCDDNGNLICRIADNIITSMEVTGGAFTVQTRNLPALVPASSALVFADEINALVGEAFFLDTNQSCVLAAQVAKLGGNDNPAVADFSAFMTSVQEAQAGLFARTEIATDVTFNGLAPSLVSFSKWSAPWIPIIMQWDTVHYPNLLPPYPQDFITTNYELDEDDIDLSYKGNFPVMTNPRTYQGTIVLTHNTEINIKEQIKSFIANFPDDDYDGELQNILDCIDLSAQAQSLSGFNQVLLMLSQVLQVEVSDPLALPVENNPILSKFTNTDVYNAVGTDNVNSPMENDAYSPLRSGALKLTRFRIIDVFGQKIDLDDHPIIRAESLKAPGDESDFISLPVRITQPARLLFRWLSARDDQVEVNSHPATTPVCGWVLFNHLDDSLVIYDEGGNALGSFNEHGEFWQGAPGNQDTYNKKIEDVFANANPHLKNFALGINSSPDPVGYLTEILNVINTSVTCISPTNYKDQQGLSVLIGRPLALVRASLDLDLMGEPSMNQSKKSFKEAIEGGNPSARDTGALPQMNIPVRLGDLSDINDGMIGYFIDDGTETAYQTFYAPAGDSSDEHGVVHPTFDQIVVNADPKTPPVLISMLMDPQASVHATTGVLPVKDLNIPPGVFSDGLSRMAVTFLTTPVLTGGAKPDLPVPEERGYTWRWVTQVETTEGGGEWIVTDLNTSEPSGPLTMLTQQSDEGWLKLKEETPDNNKPDKED